ncbi:putative Serine/threonine-protein phosphatase 4 regulatory subunit 2 [Nannochloris sp. 'desiccata']|nr:hypothetical protein KSW81_008164 [Chlorella desiccata (nom. nud.)]KAH7619426.1 putative Serine/threonine-protein phosphatase 4 regulatory subunit 2 [Chlorella desiccata (nom. nud.)]
MMTAQGGLDIGNEGSTLDPSTSNDSAFIADTAELERFASSEPLSSQITPGIRGVIAEVALTGLRRYHWQLLLPILHRLLDAALDSFTSIDLGEGEAGPPRPMPDGGALEQSRTYLHSMLDDYSHEAPFTIQRLCEVILEPRKQYSRIDKFVVAVERLLSVTSTVGITPPETLPPVPQLSSLGEVNENRPSPYDGEPPAGPQPSMEDRPQPMGNGMMDSEEYAIFIGAETGQHSTGELVAIDGHGHKPHGSGGMAVGSPLVIERIPTPMEPAEVIQAEAFVQAALATTLPSPSAMAGIVVGGGEKEPVAAAVAAAVAASVMKPVMEAAAASAAETQQQNIQQQQQQVREELAVRQPMETTIEQAVADDQQPNEHATPSGTARIEN